MNEPIGHHVGYPYHTIVARDSAQVHAGDINLTLLVRPEKEQDRKKRIEKEKCHRALKTSSYEDFKDRNPYRVDGTCRWVLTHPQFHRWRQSEHDDLLWISADPGCGKSVLARSLVDHDLHEKGQTVVCYFFFKDNEKQDSLATAMCAILHQLFDQRPDLIRYAIPTWDRNGLMIQHET